MKRKLKKMLKKITKMVNNLTVATAAVQNKLFRAKVFTPGLGVSVRGLFLHAISIPTLILARGIT